MVPLCPKNIFSLVETRVHAAFAMPATLAAPGAIFQASPAPCPWERRLARGAMQDVPCGACSNTRLLPASTFQPLPASIRSVRKNNTGIIYMCFCSSKNGPYIRTRLVTPQEKMNTLRQPRPQTLSLLPRRAAARAAGERRLVYPCLHLCPRTHVEIRGRNGPGRGAPKPYTNPIHMCIVVTTTAVRCCYCCCRAAAAEVNLVRTVAATTAGVLLLRLIA